MLPPLNPNPLHSTKEIRGHILFQGAISRWAWRLCTHRVTRPGLWFLGMTSAFALYGATSLNLQVFVPFTYAAGLWLAGIFAALAFPPRLLSLTMVHAGQVEAGRVLSVTAEIEVKRTVYDAVLLPRRLPPAIDMTELSGISLGTLYPGERRTATYGLSCTRRGQYVLRGCRIQSDFPFGLLRAYTAWEKDSFLLVTPQFTPLVEIDLPVQRSSQPGGAALSSARGASLEFIGDREFREGDSIRDIDWRATARLDRLVVREFREEYTHHAGLFLDTQAQPGEAFEAAVSLCAAASEFFVRSQYALDCLVAGTAHHDLGGGLGSASHERALDILAVAAATKTWTEPAEMAQQWERISVAVCVLLDWDEDRRALMLRIAQGGTALRILIIRESPCTLDPGRESSAFGGIITLTSAQIFDGLDRF